jgi:DNA polymerase delta subunit 1
MKLSFDCEAVRQTTKYMLRDLPNAADYATYGASTTADLLLSHAIKLESWIEVPEARCQPVKEGAAKCRSLEIAYEQVKSLTAAKVGAVVPLVQLCLDIETASEDGKNSEPEREHDVIFAISTATHDFHSKEAPRKVLFALEPCELGEEPVDFELRLFESEEELLMDFANYFDDVDPDVLYSWNGDGFDFRYIFRRAESCGILEEFSKLLARSTDPQFMPAIVHESFASRAYGTSEFFRLQIPLRVNIDLLFYFRRSSGARLDNYKLNTVAFHFLGQEKMDVHYKDMWSAWDRRDAAFLGKVARYAVRDVELPLALADKCMVLMRIIELSRVTFVPISWIATKGEQAKVFSMLMWYSNQDGYLIPDETYMLADKLASPSIRRQLALDTSDREEGMFLPPDEVFVDDDTSFLGAVVLDPICGFYNEPIRTLDFASLYPSIIRGFKLCYTSWVFDERYADIPGVDYHTVDVLDPNTNRTLRYKFAQHDKTVLPRMQNTLADMRAAARKQMKSETDPVMLSILDARQQAVKISMNGGLRNLWCIFKC